MTSGHPATARPDVACPGCGYVPTRNDRWECSPDGCGNVWDTFETAARCPACDARFPWTMCPRCGQTNPHNAWYRQSA